MSQCTLASYFFSFQLLTMPPFDFGSDAAASKPYHLFKNDPKGYITKV